MICRKSVAAMLAANEAEAYVDAVIQLKNPALSPSIINQAQALGAESRYDDYVWMHQAAFSLIHLGPQFGPWHRELLRQFELDLQAVAGDDSLYIPYWDWPNGNSSDDDGWPFVNELMGGLGGNAAASYEVATGRFASAAGDWPINVRDSGQNHTALRRVPTTDDSSPSIPSLTSTRTALAAQPYDSVPYNQGSFPSPAQATASFRKSLEFFLHNGPHNWVGAVRNNNGTLIEGLDMLAQSSPNDPVFFLHHAAIDRVWQIWQERQLQTNSLSFIDSFVPTSGADAGHNRPDVMNIMDQSYFNWPVLDTNVSNLDLHSTGIWYDSDSPVVSITTPSINFGTIPAGMTTYQPVQFNVEGCRLVQFRILGTSGGAFSIPPGNAIQPFASSDTPDARIADVYIACTAPIDGSAVSTGTANIEAFIIDSDGYLTGTVNSEIILASELITLDAAVAPRLTSAVAFVSDRSGSMSNSAGTGITRFDLLEEALEVANDLLEPDDSSALVFFDAAVSTPLSISTVGDGSAVQTALNDPAIQPSGGRTGIGAGLIAGATELNNYVPPADVPNPNLAIVCLTDGNQNEDPDVEADSVTNALAAYTNDLYAIGLGTEGGVSEDTLGAISNYMMITGEVNADIRRFMLTKYFVQILADIKKADIIVDPEGTLYPGLVHEVHFDVSEADVSLDIITLSALAKYINIEVVTPGGDVLSASSPGPNTNIRSNRLDTIFSIGLPALPGSTATSHAGRWTIRLGLEKGKGRDRTDKLLAARALSTVATTQGRTGVNYNVLVQTRSNLSMSIGNDIPRVLPGKPISLAINLSQYSLPLSSASVITTVTDTLGQTQVYTHVKTDGTHSFVVSIPAPRNGIYSCRTIASGTSMGGKRFTREATRTFSVGHPLIQPPTQVPAQSPSRDLCAIISCLLKDKGIQKLLASKNIDLKKLEKCLKHVCNQNNPKDEEGEKPCKSSSKHTTATATLIDSMQPQQVLQLLRMASSNEKASGVSSELPSVISHTAPTVDAALFGKAVFMPVLAWDKDGKTINVVADNTKPTKSKTRKKSKLL